MLLTQNNHSEDLKQALRFILTPGMAHSPQSNLLMDTNCSTGSWELVWGTRCPVESLFHLCEAKGNWNEFSRMFYTQNSLHAWNC